MPSNKLGQPKAQPISPGRKPGLRPTTELGENPKDGYGLAKTPLSLIPTSALILQALGFGLGDLKYGAYNWRVSKVRLRVYIEAIQRHCQLLLDGEDIDEESGIPHVGLILTNGGIIADAMYGGAECIDDRPVAGNGGELMRFANAFMKEMSQLTKEAADARSRAQGDHDSGNKRIRGQEGRVPTRARSSVQLGHKRSVAGGRTRRAGGKVVLQELRDGVERKPDKGKGRKQGVSGKRPKGKARKRPGALFRNLRPLERVPRSYP